MKIKRNYQLLKLIAYSSPVLLFGSLNAQEKDPFVKKEGGDSALNKAMASKLSDEKLMMEMNKAEQARRQLKMLHTTFEIFSLPANDAVELSRAKTSGAEMYEKVIKMVKEKKANVELSLSMKSRSGERSTKEATQTLGKNPKADAEKKPVKERDESKKVGLKKLEVMAIMCDDRGPFPLTPKGLAILNSKPKLVTTKSDPFGDESLGSDEQIQFEKDVFLGVRNKDLKYVDSLDVVIKQSFSELLSQPVMKAKGYEAHKQVVSLSSFNSGAAVVDGVPEILGTFTPLSKILESNRDKKEVWFAFVTVTIKTMGK